MVLMGKVLSVNDDLHAPGCGTAWGMAGVAGNTPGALPPRTAPPLPSHLGSLQSPATLGRSAYDIQNYMQLTFVSRGLQRGGLQQKNEDHKHSVYCLLIVIGALWCSSLLFICEINITLGIQ